MSCFNRVELPGINYDPCNHRHCQSNTTGHGNLLDANGRLIKAICSRETGRQEIAFSIGPGFETSSKCSQALTLVGNQPLAESDRIANPDVLRGVHKFNEALQSFRDEGLEDESNYTVFGETVHDYVMYARGIEDESQPMGGAFPQREAGCFTPGKDSRQFLKLQSLRRM